MTRLKRKVKITEFSNVEELTKYMSGYLENMSHFSGVTQNNSGLKVNGEKLNFNIFDDERIDNIVNRLNHLRSDERCES